MNSTAVEIVGYIGSLLVLVSFLMTSVFKLRIVNTVGSFIFMIYALIIHSYPTAIMNFCLVIINLRFLWKMRNTGNEYDLVKLEAGDKYLDYVLNRQYDDIRACFPGIDISPKTREERVTGAYMVTCKGAPVGIDLVENEGDGEVELLLDYSFPEYRDFSIGGFLMNKMKEMGVKKLIYKGPTENHMAYLGKMGFKKMEDRYEKVL